MKQHLKSKTVLTGIAGLITAIAGGYTGAIPLSEALVLGFTSAQALFQRVALAKAVGQVEAP